MTKKSNVEKIRTIRAKKVKIGTILQTRDEFFKRAKNYRKPGYEDKGNYRKAGVIDKNANDELALVKFVSKGIFTIDGTNLKYQPYVETLDDENKPIRIGSKFIPTKRVLSKKQVKSVRKNCVGNKDVVNKHLRKNNIYALKSIHRQNKKGRS